MSEATERPPLRVLRYVNPMAFSPRHAKLLRRLADHAMDGTTAGEWAARIARGETWLWDVGEGDEPPIVLLSTVGLPPEKLFVEGAAGNGIIAAATDIVADLHVIARTYGCRLIEALSARDGFNSLPDKLGFVPAATVWQLEVDDGSDGPEKHNDDL